MFVEFNEMGNVTALAIHKQSITSSFSYTDYTANKVNVHVAPCPSCVHVVPKITRNGRNNNDNNKFAIESK